MAEIQLNPPPQVVERNIVLTSQVMQTLIQQPQALAQLPDQFELVVLPENDPEMWVYNLSLMQQATRGGMPLVLALMGDSKTTLTTTQFYVPVIA